MPIFFESTADSIPDDPGEVVTYVARLAVDAGDVRAQAFELAYDFLVATVEVIDVVEHGRPVGAEGSDHERRAGADVGHRDRASVQRAGSGDDGAKVGGLDVFEHTLAPGRGDGEGVGSRLDVVGDHAMGGTAQLRDAFDLQHIGANSVDPGPHLAEEHGQVDDMRLAGRVVDGGDRSEERRVGKGC